MEGGGGVLKLTFREKRASLAMINGPSERSGKLVFLLLFFNNILFLLIKKKKKKSWCFQSDTIWSMAMQCGREDFYF